ncbi:TPM domain-containing protein [Persicirhabdus sediminis]|uniref:TPM domain-containing protein n=1 Tax=Persicirhabdus sediminis TaxID=454144 RepID=A0A8J7SJU5_9BACT|nr:TPM domain-containing protein [Persicirhabdus sediminis]MBK1791594.1 TPM domain-containing protein [Persicirhabdus sediminis]
MYCPRCLQRIHRGANDCPHCDFSLPVLLAELDDAQLVGPCLSDSAGALKAKERRALNHLLERFRYQFPQVSVAVHFETLPFETDLRERAFFLQNGYQCSGSDVPVEQSLTVLLDMEKKEITMCYGYAFEEMLSEQMTFDLLVKTHPYLLQSQYLRAIKVLLVAVAKVLRRSGKRIWRSSND